MYVNCERVFNVHFKVFAAVTVESVQSVQISSSRFEHFPVAGQVGSLSTSILIRRAPSRQAEALAVTDSSHIDCHNDTQTADPISLTMQSRDEQQRVAHPAGGVTSLSPQQVVCVLF